MVLDVQPDPRYKAVAFGCPFRAFKREAGERPARSRHCIRTALRPGLEAPLEVATSGIGSRNTEGRREVASAVSASCARPVRESGDLPESSASDRREGLLSSMERAEGGNDALALDRARRLLARRHRARGSRGRAGSPPAGDGPSPAAGTGPRVPG